LNFKKLAIIVVLGMLGFFGVFRGGSLPPVFTAQSDSQAEVTVEVTPKKLGPGEEENIFEAKFTTHSIDLDFDFAQISVLTDDLGNNYQPLRWEGGRGGHHLTGQIVFPKINSKAKKVTLTIRIDGEEKVFTWNLTQ